MAVRFPYTLTSFGKGEVAPEIKGLPELKEYRSSFERLENAVVKPIGGIVNTPGTVYASTLLTDEAGIRLVSFVYSDSESFVLAFTENTIKFFSTYGEQVLYTNIFEDGDFSEGISEWTDISIGTATVTYNTGLALSGTNPSNEARAYKLLQNMSIGDFDLNITVTGTVTYKIGTTLGGSEIASGSLTNTTTTLNFTNTVSRDVYIHFSAQTIGTVTAISINEDQPLIISNLSGFTNFDEIDYAQEFDIMYLVDGVNSPKQLTRVSNNTWTFADIDFTETPYNTINQDKTKTLTPSTTTGTGTLTSSFNAFVATDVGRYIRILSGVSDATRSVYSGDGTREKFNITFAPRTANDVETWTYDAVGGKTLNTNPTDYSVVDGQVVFVAAPLGSETVVIQPMHAGSGQWGVIRITAYNSETSVDYEVIADIADTNETSYWALGAWSETTGYPKHVYIHEERVWYSNTTDQPNSLNSSELSNYTGFAPDGILRNGTVDSSAALNLVLSSNTSTHIKWISGLQFMAGGTESQLFSILPRSGEGISPIDLPRRTVDSGVRCEDALPVKWPKELVFAGKGGKIYSATYADSYQGYVTSDLTILSSHLIEGRSIKLLVNQFLPNNIIWIVDSSGQLFSLTLNRDLGITAFARHDLGGTNASILSATAIKKSNGDDQVYFAISRSINGHEYVYLEYLADFFRSAETDIEDAEFLKASLKYDGTIQVASLTVANNTIDEISTITASQDTFISADVGNRIKAGNGLAEITSYISATVVEALIISEFASDVLGLFGWEFQTKRIASLAHLEGETISAYGDGTWYENLTVTSGIIEIPEHCSTILAGYSVETVIKPLPPVISTKEGLSLGRKMRISSAVLGLHECRELKVGTDLTKLKYLTVRDLYDNMDTATPVFSGMKEIIVSGTYSFSPDFYIVNSAPVPIGIISISLMCEL